jgi:hypothetical protein
LVITVLTWTISYFALGGLLTNVVLGIRLIDQIFQRNAIQVYPLHPDNSGGLGAMGRYSLKLSLIALALGLFIVAAAIASITRGIIQTDYILFALSLIYLAIVPTLFFLPLRTVHAAMVAFRDNLFRETSNRYLSHHLNLHQNSEIGVDELENNIKYLDQLKALREHDKMYPVWPFDLRIRLTVFFTTILPILPSVIGIATDLFS